jgi:hypothetical protein
MEAYYNSSSFVQSEEEEEGHMSRGTILHVNSIQETNH